MKRTETPEPKQPEPRDLEETDWLDGLPPALANLMRSEREKHTKFMKFIEELNEIKGRLE